MPGNCAQKAMTWKWAACTAYSTLGWFSDPLVSTFINYPDAELARLIFHELAHQVVYVRATRNSTNRLPARSRRPASKPGSNASATRPCATAYDRYKARKRDFLALLLHYRGELERTYKSIEPDETKRATKARLFIALQNDYQVLKASWGGYAGYDRFFAEPLSNAHLASVATYNDFVPAFRALLQREKTWPAFLPRRQPSGRA